MVIDMYLRWYGGNREGPGEKTIVEKNGGSEVIEGEERIVWGKTDNTVVCWVIKG